MKHLYSINKGTIILLVNCIISIILFNLILGHKGSLYNEFIFIKVIFVISPLIIGIVFFVKNARVQKEKEQVSIDTVLYSISIFIKNIFSLCLKIMNSIFQWVIIHKNSSFNVIVLITWIYTLIHVFYLAEFNFLVYFMLLLLFLNSLIIYYWVFQKHGFPQFLEKSILCLAIFLAVLSLVVTDISIKVKNNIKERENSFSSKLTYESREYLYQFPYRNMTIAEYFYFEFLNNPLIKLYEEEFSKRSIIVRPLNNVTISKEQLK